ncbi:MAG: cell wall-binding repeat-containing protein [Mycetocola sp.]
MRRIPPLLTTALVSIGLVAGTVSPAVAEPAAVDTSTVVQVEGSLLVFAGGDQGREITGDGTVGDSTPHEDVIYLKTDAGLKVELTGDILDDAISGSTFSGTVSLTADVAAQVEETLPDDVNNGAGIIDGGSELGTTILEATVDLDASLDVVDAEITEPVWDGTVSPRAHTLDIAILTLPSKPGDLILSDSEVNTMVANLNSYWPGQTAGQISKVSRPAAVQRIVTASACDPELAWEVAAPKFGASTDYYGFNADSDHLVVIAPTSCEAAGFGSVGSLESGGLIWAKHLNLVTTHTIAHEFGHNLGLNHSNAQFCHEPVSEGLACSIYEYEDLYDIMGAGFLYESPKETITNRRLMALNVTHKAVLHSLSATDLPTLTLDEGPSSTTDVTLQPASALSGVRGIRVVDPRNYQAYYLEFRSGTGLDEGSVYASDRFYGLGIGVRILKLESDGSSTVITQPAGSLEERNLFFEAGDSFTSETGGLTFTVTGIGAAATVSISLGTQPTVAVGRFAGSDRFMTGVDISKKSFSPDVPVVYVATGLAFPDALAAAPAAAAQGGPLLLTNVTSLPASVTAEIVRLKPQKIVVVGGTGAVSASVYNQLKLLAPSIRRDAGTDRFETSRTIVEKAFPAGSETAFVATAWNYPDALAASAAAGAINAPVVLVDGKGAAVDAKTKTLLSALKVKKAFVAGGAGAVSAKVEASLKTLFGSANVTRLGGTDRYTTASVINKASFALSDTAYFANGSGFADALSGAALAGKNKAPLYTVYPHCVPKLVLAELARLRVKNVVLLGGAGALNNNVASLTACK